jgi:symplekin
MGMRLAQEKALKRQLEEEQKLKPAGVGAAAASSCPARPGPPPAEEAMDFREEGPECETPAIFISMDDDSGLTEAALLDSSLEGPLPKVGVTARAVKRGRVGWGRGARWPEAPS